MARKSRGRARARALPPSTELRALLRKRINERVAELETSSAAAAQILGLSPSQMSRLASDQDIFSLDLLVDAAARIGLNVRMSATRPYQHS